MNFSLFGVTKARCVNDSECIGNIAEPFMGYDLYAVINFVWLLACDTTLFFTTSLYRKVSSQSTPKMKLTVP